MLKIVVSFGIFGSAKKITRTTFERQTLINLI